jgi:uncharacterized protein
MKGIADTGFIVAFLNRRDQFHQWAVDIANEIEPPMLTCEAVLAEAAFHLRSAKQVLALIDLGLIRLDIDLADCLSRVSALSRRYQDRSPDLADLCLICLSERFPTYRIATVDSDFKIYRRTEREIIPILMPSGGAK